MKIAVIKYKISDPSVNKVYRVVDLIKMEHTSLDIAKLNVDGFVFKEDDFIYLNLENLRGPSLGSMKSAIYPDLVDLYDDYIVNIQLGRLIDKI